MDHNLFLAINGLAGRWSTLDKIGGFFGGDYFLYLFAFLVALLWFHKKFRQDVYIAILSAVGGRIIITEILKRLIDRPRPYEVLKVHQLITDHEHGVSFPSGHATIYFALAFAFWGTDYFWPFFIAATLGGLARVFVGVHYPLDILAGAIIGWLSVWIVKRLLKKRILS